MSTTESGAESGPSERVDTPAIGPPSVNTERRQSPSILAPASRIMDPTGARRRIVTVVAAAGHLLNDIFVRLLRADEGVDVLAQAGSLIDAEASIFQQLPHVALLGLDLGRDTPGVIELCSTLRRQAPTVAVVVVADADRPEEFFTCFKSGAFACFSAKASTASLHDTIVGAHRYESMFTPGVARLILDDYARLANDPDALIAPAPALTPTETEVLQRLSVGETPEAVAERHAVTRRMVGLHVGYAVTKLHRAYDDDAQFRAIG